MQQFDTRQPTESHNSGPHKLEELRAKKECRACCTTLVVSSCDQSSGFGWSPSALSPVRHYNA